MRQKDFAVHSDDIDLLKTFERKLVNKGFGFNNHSFYSSLNNKHINWLYIVVYSDFKEYAINNHTGSETKEEYIYKLPQQWNKAIEHLEQITKPQFKIGDWVVWSGKDSGIGKIERPCKTFDDSWALDISNKHTSCSEKNLRHATKEEIKNELIRRSGLKMGDNVYSPQIGTSNYVIEEFEIIDNEYKGSISCKHYYLDHGLHLAARGKGIIIPVSYLKKDEIDFEIPVGRYEFKPKVNNGNIEIGECSNKLILDWKDLIRLRIFMNFCKKNELSLTFDEHGNITKYCYKGEGDNKLIKPYKIDKLKKALEK